MNVTAHTSTLLDTIETQRFGCELAGSPLYAALLKVVAEDVVAGGPCRHLLDPLADEPVGEAVLLRFLGAVHLAVLAGDAPDLAGHYPSVGGEPHGGLAAAFLVAVEANADVVADGLGRCVQTNEVGRSAALIGGYLTLAHGGLPLRIREVGSSAGLNLLADRYRYQMADGDGFGPTDSPLVFDDPWPFGRPDLDADLEVSDRRGCDPSPIDVTTDDGRQRLRSFVWPDQTDRLVRLDAALAVAQAHPPVIDTSDAVTWLGRELAQPVAGCTTVVSHSIVLQYLAPDDRAAMIAVVEGAGERASESAPLAWLRLEPGGDQAELRLTRWPGGTTRLLAKSSYHGPPVVWR